MFEMRAGRRGFPLLGCRTVKATALCATLLVGIAVAYPKNAAPSKLTESQIVIWNAPQINHFVRRSTLEKFEERTLSIMSEELADFTRGP